MSDFTIKAKSPGASWGAKRYAQASKRPETSILAEKTTRDGDAATNDESRLCMGETAHYRH